MITSLIVAVSNNYAIGLNNDLLWHIPADMRFFKKTTTSHCIITGRKNYESIPEKYRPLANRTNIVVTRDKDYIADGAVIKNTLEDALSFAKTSGEQEVFVIGGGQIYKECLEKGLIDKMYVTHVDALFDADTFFPKIDHTYWGIKSKIHLESKLYKTEVVVYIKKKHSNL